MGRSRMMGSLVRHVRHVLAGAGADGAQGGNAWFTIRG